jgi:hypothetical protein
VACRLEEERQRSGDRRAVRIKLRPDALMPEGIGSQWPGGHGACQVRGRAHPSSFASHHHVSEHAALA